MLVGIGTIIAVADPLIFWTIVAAAAIGAALGDWLSYWVGYHYHAQIQQMWPLKNHPKILEKGRVFFKRWGAWGIVWEASFPHQQPKRENALQAKYCGA